MITQNISCVCTAFYVSKHRQHTCEYPICFRMSDERGDKFRWKQEEVFLVGIGSYGHDMGTDYQITTKKYLSLFRWATPVGDTVSLCHSSTALLVKSPYKCVELWKTKENMPVGGYTLLSNRVKQDKRHSEKFQEGKYTFF